MWPQRQGTILERELARVAYIIECIYKARSFNLVIPLSFIMNLVTYLTTRCQSMNKVVAKICPGGSYTHISKWIAANTKDKLIPQSACLKWSMDNSQRICKSWLLRPQSKMPTSICTANSYIMIGNYGNSETTTPISTGPAKVAKVRSNA